MTQDPFYEPDAPTSYQTPPVSNAQNKNKTLIIVIVVVAVLLLCCCCAAAAWFLWNNGDQILYELGLSSLLMLIN